MFMDDLKLYGKNERQIDSLINTVQAVSEDIGMEFGIDKCGVLNLKRGKVVESDGIEMPNGVS
uniref:Reverse transcriptase domain-containing protein n=1 Tax=Amphimedon queenslandica TaxID=400682 RepID=A0A1X7SGU0_AMPQE